MKLNLLFKLSNLNSNFALTLGYLNPALNNPAQKLRLWSRIMTCVSITCHKFVYNVMISYLLRKQVMSIDHVNHKHKRVFQLPFDKTIQSFIFVPSRGVYDADTRL